MFGMVANRGFFVLADFYFVADPVNTLLIKAGYIGLISALTAFFFAVELILPYRTHQCFTILGAAHIGFAAIIPGDLLEAVAISIAIVTLVCVMLFMSHVIKHTAGDVQRSVNIVVIGFIMGYIGFILASDMSFSNFGVTGYVIGQTLLIVGLTSFGIGIIISPALDELDWRTQLVELYIIQSGGLLVFHHEFEENPNIDQALTAAGISGIQSMFKEITSSDSGLNVVSIGEYDILFAHGRSFSSVLIAKKPYQVLVSKVEEFTERFEGVFGSMIDTFEGSLREFSSANEIVLTVF